MLLEEFDNNQRAVINPQDVQKRVDGMPKVAIACFSHILFDKIVSGGKCIKIAELHNTAEYKNVYEIEYNNHKFALFKIGVGAPVAVCDIEDMHVMGVEKFIIFGNCGVLDSSIEDCSIIIPNKALRDEGTSFHYMEPSRSVDLNKKYVYESGEKSSNNAYFFKNSQSNNKIIPNKIINERNNTDMRYYTDYNTENDGLYYQEIQSKIYKKVIEQIYNNLYKYCLKFLLKDGSQFLKNLKEIASKNQPKKKTYKKKNIVNKNIYKLKKTPDKYNQNKNFEEKL